MTRQAPCVLVVEDEPARSARFFIQPRGRGLRRVVAANGDEALLLVREEPPDLMVLDWMLPDVSGIEVCRQVKADPATPEHPDHHAVRALRGGRPRPRPRDRRRRLRREALFRGRADGPPAHPAAPHAPRHDGRRLSFADIILDAAEPSRLPRGPGAASGPDRVPAAVHADGKARPRLDARAASGPGLGPRHLRRHPHHRRACRPPAQGADAERRRQSRCGRCAEPATR